MALSIQSIGRSFPQHNNTSKPKADFGNSTVNNNESAQKSHNRYYQVRKDPLGNKASITYEAIANVNKQKPHDSIAGFDAFI